MLTADGHKRLIGGSVMLPVDQALVRIAVGEGLRGEKRAPDRLRVVLRIRKGANFNNVWASMLQFHATPSGKAHESMHQVWMDTQISVCSFTAAAVVQAPSHWQAAHTAHLTKALVDAPNLCVKAKKKVV